MKKLYHFFFILLLCSQSTMAQDLIGKVTDQDAAQTPLYMAEVDQIQNGKIIASYKTYFDGTYHLKVTPGQTYQLRASFPGRTDTTVSISVDKHGALYTGTVYISLRKDGMRLTGYVLDGAQDLPIRDACIILRNVMTRKEERHTTGTDGSYNLKMDYETNYTFKIDKMSPGIINKYQDTSFNISTIGFNKPLDFRLDIRLRPSTENTTPRPEYDLNAKPDNRNLKPALMVLGVKDSLQKHKQDSLVSVLNKKLHAKDSVIASLDKRIIDIRKTNNEGNTTLVSVDTSAKRISELAKKREQKTDSLKQHLAEEHQKAEVEIAARRQAEKERQAKLDKEINDAETRKKQQQAQAAERDLNAITAAKEKIKEDSLLKIALEKNKEILARRKHVKDSLSLIEDQRTEAKVSVPRTSSIFRETDGSMVSISPPENPMPEGKTDMVNTVEAARIKDSIKIKQALDIQKRKKPLKDSLKAEQDSLLVVAIATNKATLYRRKQIADSLAVIESQKLEAANLKGKQRLDSIMAEKYQHEKQEKENKAKEEQEMAEKEAAIRKEQLEREQAASKKVREEKEKKLKLKNETEAAEQVKKQHQAEEEAKQKTKAEADQRELEAKKAQEQKEKEQLKEQLNKLNQNEPAVVNDKGAKLQEANTSASQLPHTSTSVSKQSKQVLVSGNVKSGKTLDGISGVSINVRRLNSIVSQEVSSDQNGNYQISLDSGYFYVVSYYSTQYEITKQLVDLISLRKSEYTVATQYLKEIDNFDPNAKMQSIQFSKNSSAIPTNIWSDLQNIIKTLEDDPSLRIKIYGLASLDEENTMDLSADRARAAADLLMQNGIKASKISTSGIGTSHPISGCTEGKLCPEQSYQLDRVVMYKIVKD